MSTPRRQYSRGRSALDRPGVRAPSPAHKFKLGQEVRFIRSTPQKISKELEQSLFMASFEISRLLPAEGAAFQYRVRNLVTGQERVAEESEIVAIESATGA
jgi:hypothetical protein